MKKAFAFTLAETLIVIGVIGIVSALTLPNLNSSTGDKERVAKVKKIYQNLQDAFGRAEAVYVPFEEWFKSSDDSRQRTIRTGERISEFMKISKICGIESNGCFKNANYHRLNNSETERNIETNDKYYKLILADGSSVAISAARDEEVDATLSIFVDIDGFKGPHTFGKDLFVFGYVENQGVMPSGYGLSFSTLISNLKNGGLRAASWIIQYDNADYLQFTNNTGKCKNGNTVTEANPRCK
ncbi:type II secretion system protein [bacterium]|nr:type II secretion system protein [bacterium]